MLRLAAIAAAVLFATLPIQGRAETLVVGVENIDYFPHYRGSTPDYSGFAREVFDAFGKDAGYTMEYRPLPIRRLFTDFFAGAIDLKYPDNEKWSAGDRAGRTISYSRPVVAYLDGVSVVPARIGQGLAAIRTLAIVRGFTPFEWLEHIQAGRIRLEEQNDFGTLLRFALAGRADAAYGNRAVIQYHLRETLRQPGALVFDRSLPFSESHYHLATTKRPDVITKFDAWMTANNGLVAQLKAKFELE